MGVQGEREEQERREQRRGRESRVHPVGKEEGKEGVGTRRREYISYTFLNIIHHHIHFQSLSFTIKHITNHSLCHPSVGVDIERLYKFGEIAECLVFPDVDVSAAVPQVVSILVRAVIR